MAFLVAYFGCINEAQAFLYLYRAGANLLLAVMLVQHDLYHTKEEALDPESDRTKAALEWAATSAGHCSPATFAQVMAIRLKQGDLDLFNKHLFSANDPLTAEDAREIHRGLHMMMTPMCVADISNTKDGLVVHVRHNLDDSAIWSETKPLVSSSAAADTRITSTTFRCDGTAITSLQSGLPSKLQDCLTIADFQKHILIASCGGDNCDYLRSLKMYLYGMIHNLYVQAFKMLHAPSGSIMRSILMAGHCYGPCDPLSNIIINSVWHETCGSILPASDRMMLKEYNDILDPLSLLRLVVRSLEGLANLALSVDPQSSIARALEKLCSARCDLVDMLSSAPKIDEIPFHEAAMAARQPLPLQLGEFHRMLLLDPEGRKLLVSHITKAQTSGVVLFYDKIREDVVALWRDYKTAPWYQPPVQAPAPELSVEALRRVSSVRSQYEHWRSWLRSKIEQVLKDYTDHHFLGPKYELDFIIGMDQRREGCAPFTDTCYLVNFMATSDENVPRTLFYAELWCVTRKPRTAAFCCPLPYAYAGRCYYDMICARKIVYPDDAKYIRDDDITHKGTRSVDGMLEMDLVHFSSELDVELARNLNMSDSQDEPNEPSSDSWAPDESSPDSDSEDESVSRDERVFSPPWLRLDRSV
ncbi:hypothetical protein CFC21_060518 [Triticum aestivum]|uniref:Uncharacterized protein n=3 Tax=Triticum aestivum TaxID=4565 RepID=A0A9R1GSL4_WHEAT|nr:hypothetical protein CFC21_060518 [Triticum aestivum]